MKRTRFVIWLLLLVQVLPWLVLVAASAGLFDPLGVFIEHSVSPWPTQDIASRFVVGATRFITFWWFLACVWLIALGAVAAIIYVAFDKALSKAERFTWALSFILGHSVTIVLFCVLKLLGRRGQNTPAVA